ncbi:MAG: ribosome maturation factor RimM [Chloroherpetonaceae bacterium]|nr:ribosome maturation factor RimM [Chloroherpetonaceae bacterium]MDW8437845.1 ribosome maturation factor RimM [Chloroherpetonaceae bacterium]
MLEVGRIVKTRGLKGEVKATLSTDFPERLKKRKKLWIGKTPDDIVQIEVKSVVVAPTFALYRFVGVETPEQAEKLVGKRLFVSENDLPKLSGDVAYIHELIGLMVLADEKPIGKLVDVFKAPANDVYVIALDGENEKRILMPAVAEFIEEVNLTNGFVKVKRYEEFL